MKYVLKNGTVYTGGKLVKCDLIVSEGKVFLSSTPDNSDVNTIVFDCDNKFIFPGFCDVHVHLREPGFSYKETIYSGTQAAAKSGYSAVFSMPNLNPVPDSVENLKVQQDIIDKDAFISVYPIAAISKGEMGKELSAMEELADHVLAFSDDGRGVQNDEMMKTAMQRWISRIFD